MLIDCDRCAVRGTACAGCRGGVVLAAPQRGRLNADESRAIEVFGRAGFTVEVLAVSTSRRRRPPSYPRRAA